MQNETPEKIHSKNNISPEEERMEFFAVASNDQEDEDLYYGTPYTDQKKRVKKTLSWEELEPHAPITVKTEPLAEKFSRVHTIPQPSPSSKTPSITPPRAQPPRVKSPVTRTSARGRGFADGVAPKKRYSFRDWEVTEVSPPEDTAPQEPQYPAQSEGFAPTIPDFGYWHLGKRHDDPLPDIHIFEEKPFSPKTFTIPVSISEKSLRVFNKTTEDVSQNTGSPQWKEKKSLFLAWKKRLARCASKTQETLFDFSQVASSPKWGYGYATLTALVVITIGIASFVGHGFALRGSVLGVTNEGVQSALNATTSLKNQEFKHSENHFEEAASSFAKASEEISSWAGLLSDIPTSVPLLSKISSGKNALRAGEHLALAGKHMTEMLEVTVTSASNPLGAGVPLLDIFKRSIALSEEANRELKEANTLLGKVRIDDIPQEKQSQFLTLKNTLPVLIGGLDAVHQNAPAFVDVLGGNGPRKYLFLFQNNHEARATGGFIGSYGLLEMKDGKVRQFFIDGIFNPSGQIKVDIVPPQPIRKISAGWNLHDSNWFADFPTSAEKAIFFYEKTGGATVDGVITITPEVLRRFLEITGPIYLPEYNVTITQDNFMEQIQYKVEIDYDKEENRPKKILSDLAPILMERVLETKDADTATRVVSIIHDSLQEKHILLYSRNTALEKMYREMGWSGELRETSRDFLSVVNSNINGFKTDGVIEQTIRHNATIQSDGSIVNTVRVTRKHNGGDTGYEWWDAVNTNYMRLYVPKGSMLLSVKGHTREIIEDPLDYASLGFQRDDLVEEIAQTLHTDGASGTQIFEESGKTVFGNWVYVSPKESVTVEYSYLLPFRAWGPDNSASPTYSLLAQKQSGSTPSIFFSDIIYPEGWGIRWTSPEALQQNGSTLSFEGDLRTDRFLGSVFTQGGE